MNSAGSYIRGGKMNLQIRGQIIFRVAILQRSASLAEISLLRSASYRLAHEVVEARREYS